jgi:hypothetical protein
MRHTIEKLSTRAITLVETSSQLDVYTQSYGPPKLLEFQFWEFRDSHLGILGQNDIWVLVPWPRTEYTIRGRWWLPPRSSRGESCESVFAHGSSMHQKCSNYALTNLFSLCKSMWITDLFVILPSPYPEALTRPSTPKVLRARERAPILSPFVVFTFGLVVESIREFGVASLVIL